LTLGQAGPVVPLLVRPIPEVDASDGISPYGYPGSRPSASPGAATGDLDWSQVGLVSVFLRDAIGVPPSLPSGTERGRVWIADPDRPSGVRKRLREQVRRNERNGWAIEVSPGPDALDGLIGGFSRAYAETMARTGASSRYLFDDAYFRTLLASDASWVVGAGRGGEILAGALMVSSDGMLHYFLGGTADSALDDSPMKNLFLAMIDFSTDSGRPLNLGGGLEPGDSLEKFKRGFANEDLPFLTHEIVCDQDLYDSLTRPDPDPGFFPSYRSPR